ncbi:MAG: VCBS repeat-containing protein [Planctomycetota bacterium]
MLALAVSLALAPPAASPTQFESPVPLTSAVPQPTGLEIVDLDGDGRADVRATASGSSPGLFTSIHWFPGLGDGQFERFRTIAPSGPSTYTISATGDVDGDGDLDLVVATPASHPTNLGFFENRGDGTFEPFAAIANLDGSLNALLVIDRDGDGRDEIVAATVAALPLFPSRFVLIERLAGGGFAPPADLDPTGSRVAVAIRGDVDGDGDLDIVSSDTGTSIAWHRNDGSLPFAAPQPVVAGASFASPVDLDDLDGDGDLDVLLLSSNGRTIEWVENLGGGAFGTVRTVAVEPSNLASVTARDLDLDGDADVVAALVGVGAVWFENLGGGAFAASSLLTTFDDCGVRSLAVGDVDADGRNDLVLACSSSALGFVRNRSAGGVLVLDPVSEFTARAPGMRSLVAADLDGNGGLDLVGVSDPNGPAQSLVASFSLPTAGLGLAEPLIERSPGLGDLELGDLDGDGDIDGVGATSSGLLLRLDNPGNGRLTAGARLPIVPQSTYAVADVDGDGDDDVAVIEGSGLGQVFWLEQVGGSFAPPRPIATITSPVGAQITGLDLEFADVDADGIPDLLATAVEAVAPTGRSSAFVLRGLGGALFGPRMDLAPPSSSARYESIQLADLDGDGDPDPLAVVASATKALVWFPNLGGGAFAPEIVIEASGMDLSDLAILDADLDGDLDLIGSRFDDPDLALWTSRGDGAFDPFQPVEGPGEIVVRLASGDFDRDGDVDLALATRGEQGLFYAANDALSAIGEVECTSLANSTGAVGSTSAFGSTRAALNAVELRSADLPLNAAGFYLTSLTPDTVVGAGGSQGVLCLGGAIGRYVGPGQVLFSGADGSFDLELDLTAVPQPSGFVAVLPGQTWRFQAWYRDAIGGTPTSNFTDGLAILFD